MTLTAELLTVPWLAEQLTVTLARLDRVPGRAGADPDPGTALPFRLAATQAATTLKYTLTPWAREVADQHHLRMPAPSTPTATLATWLARHIEHARRIAPRPDHYGAGQLADEIRYAVDQVRRVIDRPPALFYGGPCDACQEDLYCGADDRGWPTEAFLICPTCSRRYDTTERREWLLRAAEDRLATAAEISQAVPALFGRHIGAGTIRQWAHRGRLAPRPPHPDDPHNRPRYRVGDVIDLTNEIRRRAG